MGGFVSIPLKDKVKTQQIRENEINQITKSLHELSFKDSYNQAETVESENFYENEASSSIIYTPLIASSSTAA